MNPTCTHDWQPIVGWYARYRCSVCGVIGYKPGAVHPKHARSMAITPYRCEAKSGGKRCEGHAVHNWRGKNFRCAAHRYPGRTAEARKELAAGWRAPSGTDRESTATDSASTATDPASVATDSASIRTDSGSIATDSESTGTDSGSMATDSESTATDSASTGTDSASIATDSGSV